MKVTVLGAGSIGAAVAEELFAHDIVTQVQVCDRHARTLQQLQESIADGPLRTFQLDARDTSTLEPILRGSACVVSALPPSLNPELARLCLEMGSHFCDLGGHDAAIEEELALDEAARKKSRWIIPGCGLAPGLVNVLCLRAVAQFDDPEAAHLRVGDVPLHPEAPFRFRISWSAEKILDDYTNPVQLIEGGRVEEADPLSREERICFDGPFDAMEAFCTQGGLSTLTNALEGKLQTLDHKTIRWPGHAHQMRFLLGLGFGEDRSIDVRTHLTYRDVLVRRMRQRLGGDYEDAVLLRVLVQGQKDGRTRTLVYEMAERYDEKHQRTAMARCTAVPTAAVAALLADGTLTGGGAAPPEKAVPLDAYCDLVEARGLQIEERWYDGRASIEACTDEDAAHPEPVASS
jgi:saccharopine dehydrogenase-like NADP-dependent oxidoreductase